MHESALQGREQECLLAAPPHAASYLDTASLSGLRGGNPRSVWTAGWAVWAVEAGGEGEMGTALLRRPRR